LLPPISIHSDTATWARCTRKPVSFAELSAQLRLTWLAVVAVTRTLLGGGSRVVAFPARCERGGKIDEAAVKDALAEKLLAHVMQWGPEAVARERPYLQAMAAYKYDEYQQFFPGMRFVESLARWLNQFRTQPERQAAFEFVKGRLLFVSPAVMNHLAESAHPDHIPPALRAGAIGYVLKEAADDELVQAVRLAAEGRTYLNPELGARLAAEPPSASGPPDDLSARELEVLRLIALGHTNGEIASRLYLSVRTVESHRAHLQQKTGRTTRADLVAYAREHGLL